jgi:hypothetical protein
MMNKHVAKEVVELMGLRLGASTVRWYIVKGLVRAPVVTYGGWNGNRSEWELAAVWELYAAAKLMREGIGEVGSMTVTDPHTGEERTICVPARRVTAEEVAAAKQAAASRIAEGKLELEPGDVGLSEEQPGEDLRRVCILVRYLELYAEAMKLSKQVMENRIENLRQRRESLRQHMQERVQNVLSR